MIRADFCVYLHLRPDGSVFYVGKGVPSRPYRRGGRNMLWQTEVKNIGGFSVQILESGLTEEQAFAKEVEVIADLKANGIVLVNQTKGGDGCKSLVFTQEIIDKLRLARAVQKPPMAGRHMPEQAKQKMKALHAGENNPMFGKKHSEQTKEKFKTRPTVSAWTGKKMDDSIRQKMSESHKSKPKLTCPHCLKTGGNAGMLVHHFNNCKLIEATA